MSNGSGRALISAFKVELMNCRLSLYGCRLRRDSGVGPLRMGGAGDGAAWVNG